MCISSAKIPTDLTCEMKDIVSSTAVRLLISAFYLFSNFAVKESISFINRHVTNKKSLT